ncbi:DUF1048 domain-containing protein [Lacticaseibacillus jixiensis]|uniref:DUF1048 domain-containing protein n=1 Tax=Lacticaseibacillus jixiensis TaxID=3231926 RepID=UPI0036F25411
MKLWDKLTGADMDRQMAAYTQTIATLPKDYQAAWQTITQTLWGGGDYRQGAASFTGRNVMPVLAGIVQLFSETAALGEPVAVVLGEDAADFAAAAAQASGVKVLQDKWRQQLNADVHKQLGR